MIPQGAYWLDKGLCWIIVQKCASTSIDVSLDTGRWPRVQRAEALAAGFPAVVFVRHPWQRIMSAIEHPLHTHSDPKERIRQHCEGKHPYLMNVHVRPVWTFTDGFDLAFVGNIENMASGWAKIEAKWGPLPTLVHENRSGARRWDSLDYDWDQLLPTYQKDFDLYERAGNGP